MQTPAVRFRIDFGRHEAVGPGKIALLEQIERGGSLSQAARALHMSYRRAWQLLESLNGCFREPVALTAKGGRGGGGATLTVFGRQLIRVYRDFEAEVQARAGRRFRLIASQARPLARGPARGARGAPVVRLKDR
jgi:molybdate transport system regulatory protein